MPSSRRYTCRALTIRKRYLSKETYEYRFKKPIAYQSHYLKPPLFVTDDHREAAALVDTAAVASICIQQTGHDIYHSTTLLLRNTELKAVTSLLQN